MVLPADSQTRSQVQLGVWKCNSSTHSLFCKQIAPTRREVGILLLAAQERHPVWPRTSEPLPIRGRKHCAGGKRVKDAATFGDSPHYFQFPRAATSAFIIFETCRLRVLWCGYWKGKQQIRSDAQYALPALGTHTAHVHCQAPGSGNRPHGVGGKKTPNTGNLGY